MALIRAAYFVQCPLCCAHGSILCSDGQMAVCYSKIGAREAATYMLKRGWVTLVEMPVLHNHIARSTLPTDIGAYPTIAIECFVLLADLRAQPTPTPATTKPPSAKPLPRRTVVMHGQEVPLN